MRFFVVGVGVERKEEQQRMETNLNAKSGGEQRDAKYEDRFQVDPSAITSSVWLVLSGSSASRGGEREVAVKRKMTERNERKRGEKKKIGRVTVATS